MGRHVLGRDTVVRTRCGTCRLPPGRARTVRAHHLPRITRGINHSPTRGALTSSIVFSHGMSIVGGSRDPLRLPTPRVKRITQTYGNFRRVIVATFPDRTLAEMVGPVSGVEMHEWDWRDKTPGTGVEATNLLVSDYNPTPPEASTLSFLSDLRAVQLPSAGYAGWPDVLPSAVTLCNGRSIHGQSTAEAVVAGVLAVLRRIPQSVVAQSKQTWAPLDVEQLAGRRVVIVGAGDIGSRIDRLLGAFGCSTVMVGRTARDGVVPAAELSITAAAADVLVLAVPLNDETEGLVDASMLRRLPDGAVVVNVSRGPVVITEALTAEVATGRLRAYLDVTDPEPLPPDHPLWTLPGSLLTPHTGGGEIRWRERYADLIRDQLTRLRDGLPLRNVVR